MPRWNTRGRCPNVGWRQPPRSMSYGRSAVELPDSPTVNWRIVTSLGPTVVRMLIAIVDRNPTLRPLRVWRPWPAAVYLPAPPPPDHSRIFRRAASPPILPAPRRGL